MAKDSDRLAGNLGTQNTGGLLTGFLAEEDEFDRRALWRLGSWGAAAVGAVIVAALANQSSLGQRRDQLAAVDLARQATQLQLATRESQSETRRLAAAVDTLNSDRDRLFSRVTVLEQGLDSATGALARQTLAPALPPEAVAKPPVSTATEASATPPAAPASPPAIATVSTTAALVTERPRTEVPAREAAQPQPAPAQPQSQPQSPSSSPPQVQTTAAASAAPLPKITPSDAPTRGEPLMGPQSMMGPPDPAATKLIEPAKTANASPGNASPAITTPTTTTAPTATLPDVATAASTADADSAEAASAQVHRIEFAVDLGTANSVGGLRALWRGLLKANDKELATLRPIIVIKERSNGLGMQLRLGAGPLSDAAAAAKICAALTESERVCETTLFDGQRLSLQAEDKPEPTPPPAAKPALSRRSSHKRVRHEEPAAPPAKPETPSAFSTLFGRK